MYSVQCTMCYVRVDLLPYDLISQLFKILSIETKQEKGTKYCVVCSLLLQTRCRRCMFIICVYVSSISGKKIRWRLVRGRKNLHFLTEIVGFLGNIKQ